MNKDPLIWDFDISSPPDAQQMAAVAKWVIHRLGDFLQTQIVYDEPLEECRPTFFRVFVKSANRFGGGFKLSWKGIVFGSHVASHPGLYVGSTVFIYSHGNKLITLDGESFIDLYYQKSASGQGEWRIDRWYKDEYGEYPEFNKE